jgi:hypothetical protein
VVTIVTFIAEIVLAEDGLEEAQTLLDGIFYYISVG